MQALISPVEAEKRISGATPSLSAVSTALHESSGRILREPIVADRPFPPFDRVMMDGYAFRWDDLQNENRFTIAGIAPAGSAKAALPPISGACFEVMTGAVLPQECDCVVRYEDTEKLNDTEIRLTDPTEYVRGDFVHPTASDLSKGREILSAGVKLGSREIALAATCGYFHVLTSQIPAITIISTGDELVPVEAIPQPHQIRRSNDLAIDAALRLTGFNQLQRLHLRDDKDACLQALRKAAAESHFLIISGGISMGKKDYIPEALSEIGLRCQFHGVAQKPGKPFGFWSNETTAAFALPGNPLSTMVCLHRYVIPAIRFALAESDTRKNETRKLSASVKARDDLTLFLPVSVNKNLDVTVSPARNSGDFVSILATDGFIELAPSQVHYPVASRQSFYPWI